MPVLDGNARRSGHVIVHDSTVEAAIKKAEHLIQQIEIGYV